MHTFSSGRMEAQSITLNLTNHNNQAHEPQQRQTTAVSHAHEGVEKTKLDLEQPSPPSGDYDYVPMSNLPA